ncbi:MAG: flagellin [Quinella sp. 1Q5]|nr:flagellin [Quinella sp. 1Q5]
MAIVINTNEQATRIHGMYNRNTTKMNAAMTRVATAQKLNTAKDGASNWAISEKMRDLMRANSQANQNVQNDTALLKTAQDGIGNTLSILTTLKERAINAANDSNVSSDRTKIAEEVKQLVAQIDDNAAKVKFNGRQLLNGAQEGGSVSKASSASSVAGVTATEPVGQNAVYSITGLNSAVNTAATSGTLLKSLVDPSGGGNALLQENDTITISWKNNGEDKQISVTANSTNDLTALLTAMTKADSNLSANDTGVKAAGATFTEAKNANGQTINATLPGFYIVGKTGHVITDVSVSVTSATGVANTRAEEVFKPNAIQQAEAAPSADKDHGSNVVYGVADKSGALLKGFDGDKTAWMDLALSTANITSLGTDGKDFVYNSHASKTDATAAATTEFTITVNGKDVKIKGATTIEELNKKFEESGVNVRAHIATSAGETLTYDGEAVIQGGANSTTAYRTTSAGLYFIGAKGEAITSIGFSGGTTSGNTNAALTNYETSQNAASGFYKKQLSIDSSWIDGSSSYSAAGGASLLPQGQALQFFVGGEANFGVNFSIGKATVANLLGGTIDSFASKFRTKEGAEAALGVIDDAINKTLVEQTRLGAMEARLGYTADNLSSMNENLEAADSAIRDADMAKEMTNYMKYSVLAQSSQYMLAQAGQNAFSVLNLLQQ